ncbi:MAG: fibronectin type III domain-containing protein, partial [Epsilonproteobacteria bacterium]|nr:fibronectin type III domain-containing protein [Campylobacterota bacterium]
GIISSVVEVGTKNIPDYMKAMSSSVNENIPALLKAFEETINYSSYAPNRVDNFTIQGVDIDSVQLKWNYELREDIYFEIYRNIKDKASCGEHNIVGITKEHIFKDLELESFKTYYYTIRAVNKTTKLKSPYAPIVKLKTKLKRSEFSRMLFALKEGTGYVGENMSEVNRSHFGSNSLFVGINKSKGICDGVISYDLSTIPKDAIIKEAILHMYPMNRVAAKIERYGEWNMCLLDSEDINDLADFQQIENATCIQVIGDAIKSQNLTQGIWNYWDFSSYQCLLLQEQLIKNKAIFRLDGPKELPYGEDSQVMQYDIGYGNFGGGLHYRPILEVKYTIPTTKTEVSPKLQEEISINLKRGYLESGYDKKGNKIYGHLRYDLSILPNPKNTIITNAYIELQNKTVYKSSKGISFYLELLDVNEKISNYTDIKNRERAEYIGYEVQDKDLSKRKTHYFMFDTLSELLLEKFHEENNQLEIIINATTSFSSVKGRIVRWSENPKLVIEYIEKRKNPLQKIEDLSYSIENGVIKLKWENPKDKDFVGAYIVRNSFHPPKNFMDGVKIYGGKDDYTYDRFGSLDRDKYYSVFAYDNVPNFSEPEILHVVF